MPVIDRLMLLDLTIAAAKNITMTTIAISVMNSRLMAAPGAAI
jgi:hypothetical protein